MLRIMTRNGAFPLHEDNRLFEMLVLESMQSGLSWITILRKRKAFQIAFHQFEPAKVAKFGSKEIEKLLANAGHQSAIGLNLKLRLPTPAPLCRFRRNTGVWMPFCGESWTANHWFIAGQTITKLPQKLRNQKSWPKNVKNMVFDSSVRRLPTLSCKPSAW